MASEKTCGHENCNRPHLAKGLCGKHYQRANWHKYKLKANQGNRDWYHAKKKDPAFVKSERGRNKQRMAEKRAANQDYRKLEQLKKAAYRADPNNKEVERNGALQYKYGITLNDYNRMHEQQGGVCAICQLPERLKDTRRKTLRKLAVDHCHATGKVRALLCSDCNTTLGKFKDDPALFDTAAAYLRKHGR